MGRRTKAGFRDEIKEVVDCFPLVMGRGLQVARHHSIATKVALVASHEIGGKVKGKEQGQR